MMSTTIDAGSQAEGLQQTRLFNIEEKLIYLLQHPGILIG